MSATPQCRILKDGNNTQYVQWKPWWCPIWFYEKDYSYGARSQPTTFESEVQAQAFIEARLGRIVRRQRSRQMSVVQETCNG